LSVSEFPPLKVEKYKKFLRTLNNKILPGTYELADISEREFYSEKVSRVKP
jgi:hypothetical protein